MGTSPAGEVMSGDDPLFYHCIDIDWASTARLKLCICTTPLSFSSFLWLSLPSCSWSRPATAGSHAESKEIRQDHSALLTVNWVSTLIQLQLYRLKLVLSWRAQKLLHTFRALQLAVHCFVSHLPTSDVYTWCFLCFQKRQTSRRIRETREEKKIKCSKPLKWFSSGNCSDWWAEMPVARLRDSTVPASLHIQWIAQHFFQGPPFCLFTLSDPEMVPLYLCHW